MIYCDYNATTPTRPEAIEATIEALKIVGNPSSVHGYGRLVRNTVEDVRHLIAKTFNTRPQNIIFTSGGTESNILALNNAPRILFSAIEHDCILNIAQSFDPQSLTIPVTPDGITNINFLKDLLRSQTFPANSVITVMFSNNETGVIQPIAELADLAHEYGLWFHCDAVQAAGKIPIDLTEGNINSLSISAHKFGGPKGVGALIHKDPSRLVPIILGGGQEQRKRSGTENVSGIAGMGAALSATLANRDEEVRHITDLRTYMEAEMQKNVPESEIFGRNAPRVANTTNIRIPGLKNETQLIRMDLAGIAVSTGAACSSGKITPSHVLQAMGANKDVSAESIRISLGWENTKEDIDALIKAWSEMARKHLQRTKVRPPLN